MTFSALICLYHGSVAAEVAVALTSALVDQTLKPAELVVVFDGPVPKEVEEVVAAWEQRLATRIVRFPDNRGHGPARAAGVVACRHEWIAIIDADDISLPQRFEKLAGLIARNPALAVVGGGVTEFVEEEGERHLLATRIMPETPAEVRRYMQLRSPVAQPTAMIRRSAVLAVGNYQPWFNNEDYHLWIRLTRAGHAIANVAEPLLLFRTSPTLYLRRGGLKYWWNEARLQAYSYGQGTTTLARMIPGVGFRFLVQVVLPNRLRAALYKRILR